MTRTPEQKERRKESDAKYRKKRGREYARAANRLHKKRHGARYRERLRAWRKEHPEAYKAHNIVSNEIRKGRLIPPSICERCGANGRIEGSHDDYFKPLEIEWLCVKCHREKDGTSWDANAAKN